MKKLTISLVTYNGERYLPACFESIARQTYTDYEFVVLDNGSTDSTRAIVRANKNIARVIQTDKNTGFSGGHNTVIRATESEYVCVLNQDLILEPDYFEQCILFMDRHPEIGSVTGLLIRVPTLTGEGARDIIDSYGLAIRKTFQASNAGAGESVATFTDTKEVLGVPATAAVYRRSALVDSALEINGVQEYFDEDFFMYKEDVDLALRLRLRGWHSGALPSARGYHIRTTDPNLFARPSKKINQWSYRNHLCILLKDVPLSYYLRWGWLIFAYESAKLLFLILCEQSTLVALRDVWRLRKKMMQKRRMIMQKRTINPSTLLMLPKKIYA